MPTLRTVNDVTLGAGPPPRKLAEALLPGGGVGNGVDEVWAQACSLVSTNKTKAKAPKQECTSSTSIGCKTCSLTAPF